MSLKNEVFGLKVELDDVQGEMKKKEDALTEGKWVKTSLTRMETKLENIMRICEKNQSTVTPTPDRYNEAACMTSCQMEMYLSTRSHDRLLNSKHIDLGTLSLPRGPIEFIPAGTAEIENFIGSAADKAHLDTSKVAIFMLEVPKNLNNKIKALRKMKLEGFVGAVNLLIDSVLSQFKAVYVAIIPCQEDNVIEAKEIEAALLEGFNETGNRTTIVPMNTNLDRSNEAVKQIISHTGRARGLAILRTIAEVLQKLLKEGSSMPINSCQVCGALCEDEKCMSVADPEKKGDVQQTENEEPAERDKREVADNEAIKLGRRKSMICWVCGEKTDILPHIEGRPCRNIGISCRICKAYGHKERCHLVKSREAREALTRKYGNHFTFTEDRIGKLKRPVMEKEGTRKDVKKPKKEAEKNLESDED